MPIFPKPKFEYAYDPAAEVARLRLHKQKRALPPRQDGRLLVATWNLANLGAQERRDSDRSLIAEVLSWFDIVALQECRENFSDLFDLEFKLGGSHRVLMSDVAGNNERLAFLYDPAKLRPLEEVGEIAFPPSEYKHITLPGVTETFNGFDRTPYLVSFEAGMTSLVFVNVHLFYGNKKKVSIERRALETFAVARWAHRRQESAFSFTRELVALGDFNMPRSEPGDPIYNALTRLGLELPDHSTQIASNITADANYDQIAFLPGTTRSCFSGRKGVFDFDGALFPDLWQAGANRKNFLAYLRYYISDHRPMWVELDTPAA